MVRTVLAVLVGLVVGALVVAGLEAAGHALFPLAPGADPQHLQAGDVPAAAMVAVLVAWAAGAFAGGLVAGWWNGPPAALAVGAILMAGGIANMIAIPSPLWFWVMGLLVFLPCAWLGGKVAARSKSR